MNKQLLLGDEALAQGENEGNYFCYGSGDIPCAGRTVKYRLDNPR